jgi:hypothetical protein
MVALTKAADPGANGADDSGALVAAAERERANRLIAGYIVVIRMTEPRGHHLDEYLAVPGRIQVDLRDLPLSGLLPEQRGSCLHQPSSAWTSAGSPFRTMVFDSTSW